MYKKKKTSHFTEKIVKINVVVPRYWHFINIVVCVKSLKNDRKIRGENVFYPQGASLKIEMSSNWLDYTPDLHNFKFQALNFKQRKCR